MSDIELVKRLRASAKAIRSDKGPELIEAADAIEALTAALYELLAANGTRMDTPNDVRRYITASESARAALRKVQP